MRVWAGAPCCAGVKNYDTHAPLLHAPKRICDFSAGIFFCGRKQRWHRSGIFKALFNADVRVRIQAASPLAERSDSTVLGSMKKLVVKLFQCFFVFIQSETKSQLMMCKCKGRRDGTAWYPI